MRDVPQLALLIGLILVLCSIGVLIFFIHHVPMRIHANNVIEQIGNRLIQEIDRRFPVFVVPLDRRADATARITNSGLPSTLRIMAISS